MKVKVDIDHWVLDLWITGCTRDHSWQAMIAGLLQGSSDTGSFQNLTG